MSAPDTSLPQLPQVNIVQPQQPNTAGMTQMGAAPTRQQGSSFKASGIPGLALMIIKAVQGRKQREMDRDMQHFVGLSAGRDEAQSQLQQTDGQIRAAMQKIQQDPTDLQARQSLVQASEARKKAQQAMQQNDQNLRDLANSSRGQKFLKQLQKAAGIDEKQMNSPERQSLIKAIQQKQNTDAQTAKLMSLMTQRQQLSPEARAQSQMQQAGVIGKPATGGQILNALGHDADRRVKIEALAHKTGMDTEKLITDMRKNDGMVPVTDEKGDIQRNPDGTMIRRNLEPEEMSAEELAKYQLVQDRAKLITAQVDATKVRAAAAKLNSQANMMRAKAASDPANIAAWIKAVQDPTGRVTLGNIPAQARGAVMAGVLKDGGKVAIPLSGDEIKRMDLATNVIDNFSHAKEILQRRPDMFGPAGWWGTKYKQLVDGGDPDAIDFRAAVDIGNLPAIGIHSMRSKYALTDIKELDSNLYLNPESVNNVLDDILRSAHEFQDRAARPKSIYGTDSTATPGKGESKTYQGHTYTRTGPGQPWTLVK